jgi:hypothetical protein
MGDDDIGEVMLMQQWSRRSGRLDDRGVNNAGGRGGRSPSVRSWDSNNRTLQDDRVEGSHHDDITMRQEHALTYAKACQQQQHDGNSGLGFEWLDCWTHLLT